MTESAAPTPALVAEAHDPAAAQDENAVVRVRVAVIDLEALRAVGAATTVEVGFAGEVECAGKGSGLQPGDLVAGTGPLADRIVARAADLLACPSGMAAETAAMAPLLSSALAAAQWAWIQPGDRVLINGSGLAASIITRLVTMQPGVLLTRDPGLSDRPGPIAADGINDMCDLLFDTTGDPACWALGLGRIADRGRVALLLPQGRQIYPFDFYSDVHRRALAMAAWRVPSRSAWRAGVHTHAAWLVHVLRHEVTGIELVRIPAASLTPGTGVVPPRSDGIGGISVWWPST